MAKWTDTLKFLGKFAPVIASAAGGPLAGSAISAIESALGLHLEGNLATKQDTIATAISNASQADLLALKTADQAFQAKMAELGFADAEALEKLSEDDRASARAREISVRDWTPMVLAYLITGGFFVLLGLLAYRSVPEGSVQILNIMVGVLGTAWVGVVSYYFGSSSGSARKTELLAQAPAIK